MQGYGTELGIAAWGFIVVRYIVYPLLMKIPSFAVAVNGHKRNTNSGSVVLKPEQLPGLSEQCRKNRDKLIKICTAVEKLEAKVTEHHTEYDKNFREIFQALRGGSRT
jgi:hypothetical protein